MRLHPLPTPELWQTTIRTDDAPVTTADEAAQALLEIGWDYIGIEPEDPANGIWLVGLVGDPADRAHRGDYVDGEGGGYSAEVPQP